MTLATHPAMHKNCEDGSPQTASKPYEITLGAEMPGYKGTSFNLKIPNEKDRVSLVLHPGATPEALGNLSADGLPSEKPENIPVVAIFE